MIAINEVAALDFVDAAMTSGDPDSYISKRCFNRLVLVSGSYVPLFRERRHRYYLAQTYELIELFYRDFRTEFEEFYGSGSWKFQTPAERNKDGDEHMMLEILRNTPDGGRLKPHPYFAVIEYYRLMRNCIVHAATDEETERKLHINLTKLREKLGVLYKDETGKRYKFDAPNGIKALQIDDIRLFSRCIQRLSRMISAKARPADSMLIKAVFGGPDGTSFRRSYGKLAGDSDQERREKRLRKALQYRLMGRFGLTGIEAEHIVLVVPRPIA